VSWAMTWEWAHCVGRCTVTRAARALARNSDHCNYCSLTIVRGIDGGAVVGTVAVAFVAFVVAHSCAVAVVVVFVAGIVGAQIVDVGADRDQQKWEHNNKANDKLAGCMVEIRPMENPFAAFSKCSEG
jgi:hypothetical protein